MFTPIAHVMAPNAARHEEIVDVECSHGRIAIVSLIHVLYDTAQSLYGKATVRLDGLDCSSLALVDSRSVSQLVEGYRYIVSVSV